MAFADALLENNNGLFKAAPPLDDMLNATCTIIQIATGTDAERDGWGNIAINDISKVTNLPCDIQPNTSFSRFKEFFQTRQAVTSDHIAYIKVRANNIDVDFIPTNRYKITDYIKNGIAQGFEFDVTAVLADGGGTRHWYMACNVVSN
jgi:hypothetical protein